MAWPISLVRLGTSATTVATATGDYRFTAAHLTNVTDEAVTVSVYLHPATAAISDAYLFASGLTLEPGKPLALGLVNHGFGSGWRVSALSSAANAVNAWVTVASA